MDRALDGFFAALRNAPRPADAEARVAIGLRLKGIACATQGRALVTDTSTAGWALAYALAWLSVAGGDSVMPPWVRHQFPEAGRLVRRLRDTACTDSACGWCRERHDARKELKRWFGFDSFRPEPAHDDGRPMQQAIVEEAMAGRHALGILPTGTGKSLCYQIPAISRYDKTARAAPPPPGCPHRPGHRGAGPAAPIRCRDLRPGQAAPEAAAGRRSGSPASRRREHESRAARQGWRATSSPRAPLPPLPASATRPRAVARQRRGCPSLPVRGSERLTPVTARKASTSRRKAGPAGGSPMAASARSTVLSRGLRPSRSEATKPRSRQTAAPNAPALIPFPAHQASIARRNRASRTPPGFEFGMLILHR